MKSIFKKIFIIYLIVYFLILISFLNSRDFFLDEGAHGMSSLFFYRFLQNPTIHIREFVFKFYSYYPALFLNQYPPLIHGITSLLYFIFGPSEFISRIIISIISVVTLYIVYRLGKEMFDEETGIIAALLLSVIPYYFTFSQVFMMEIPMVFFFTIAGYIFYKKKSPWLLGLVMALNFYTKFPSVILWGVIGLYSIWTKSFKKDLIYLLKASLLFLLLTVPFLVFIYQQTGLIFGLNQLSPKEGFTDIIFWEIEMNFIKNERLINLLYFPYHLLYYIPIFILVLSVFGTWKLNNKKKFLLLWVVFFVLVLTIIPNKTPKYVIYVLPPVVILAAAGLQNFKPKQKNLFILFFVLLSLALLILNPLSPDADIKEGYDRIGSKELSEFMGENISKNATILLMNKESYNIIFSFAKNNNFENKIIRTVNCKFKNITENEFRNFIRKNNVQFIVGSEIDPIYIRLSDSLKKLPVVKEYSFLKIHENKNIDLEKMPKICNYNCFLELEFCEN